MAAESEGQRFAVITSMIVGALLGPVAGMVLGHQAGGEVGCCCFGGFGLSGGLMAGCIAATLFAWLLKPSEPGGPEADYDDGPPPAL